MNGGRGDGVGVGGRAWRCWCGRKAGRVEWKKREVAESVVIGTLRVVLCVHGQGALVTDLARDGGPVGGRWAMCNVQWARHGVDAKKRKKTRTRPEWARLVGLGCVLMLTVGRSQEKARLTRALGNELISTNCAKLHVASPRRGGASGRGLSFLCTVCRKMCLYWE